MIAIHTEQRFSMFHFLFIVAFGVIATITALNMVRSFMMLNTKANIYPKPQSSGAAPSGASARSTAPRPAPHPEMFDESGQPVNEPLLVVRSLDVEDARQRLDSLYNASPGNSVSTEEDA